jgi:hypothetical protein
MLGEGWGQGRQQLHRDQGPCVSGCGQNSLLVCQCQLAMAPLLASAGAS